MSSNVSRQVLHPKLLLTESLGALLKLNAEKFVQLSKEQLSFLKGVLQMPRMRVRGGAGTGKTVLALETAKRLATDGKRVLLVCYNLGLSKYLAKMTEDWENGQEQIQVNSFHGLCRQAFRALDKPFVVPSGEDREASSAFWNEAAPLVLLEALEKGKIEQWDAIVVDEGQDFAADWWSVIEDCMKDKEFGSLLVFYDPHQEIFGCGCHVPESEQLIQLNLNLRNTRAIFEKIRVIVDVDMEPHPGSPRGQEPSRNLQKSKGNTLGHIEDLLERYIKEQHVNPDQIALITPHTKEHSLFAGIEAMAGCPLASDPFAREGAILHTTIGSFKGLESDIVILADIDPEDERCNVNARYVATSRARQVLHEYWKKEW